MICFRDVKYRRGDRWILRGINLRVEPGEAVALLGRSGSGKTTILKLVNRLLAPTSGTIDVLGRPTASWALRELRHSIGYVMQQGGLFPHLTAAENVSLVLRLTGREARVRTAMLFDLIGLPVHEYGGRYPHELSGGQQQRVAVARALALDPPLLLLDEPFTALDPLLRAEMQQQFLDWRQQLGKTTLFVTHDLNEAVRVADRIVLIHQGCIDCEVPAAEFTRATGAEAQAFREAFWLNRSPN